MKSYTIDEFESLFKTLVLESDRHNTGTYVSLDGSIHSTDVGYFEECMPYFIQDLRYLENRDYDENRNIRLNLLVSRILNLSFTCIRFIHNSSTIVFCGPITINQLINNKFSGFQEIYDTYKESIIKYKIEDDQLILIKE